MKLILLLVFGIVTMATTQNLPSGGHSVEDLISGKAKLDAPPGKEYTGEYKPAPPGAIIQPVRKANGDSLNLFENNNNKPAIQPPRLPSESGYPSEPKLIDGRYNAHGPKYVTLD